MSDTISTVKELLDFIGLPDQPFSWSTGMEMGNEGRRRKIVSTFSPIDGSRLADVQFVSPESYEIVLKSACNAFDYWRTVPAPKRGDIVRQIGNEFRANKELLATLVTCETGKIYQEAMGEVQEMIDICDYAVGLSRQLHGFTMHSERPEHQMYEQYHPLGVVGIITAFNFPVAVWGWNAMIAAVCGDVTIWKPSNKVPLTALACFAIIAKVLKENEVPGGVFNLLIGDEETGKLLSYDSRIHLISATGSVRMGKSVAMAVASRLGKVLLELGGNNAIIVTPNANLGMAVRAALFGAVGTAGQRCTTTRRLIVHGLVYEAFKEQLVDACQSLKIGHPLRPETHLGPLIDHDAVRNFEKALSQIKREGGEIIYGGEILKGEEFKSGTYVKPAIVEAENHFDIVQAETFAPILYLIQYDGEVEDAIRLQNGVRQGLSSAIFTRDLRESEIFLSAAGSDCGIANVNIGTSGAEIGGAFGGEKDTGGGREAGSDAWKAYMRRQTNTINYSGDLPLAQGIIFDV